jgi:hypothetical protein
MPIQRHREQLAVSLKPMIEWLLSLLLMLVLRVGELGL